MVGQRQQLWGVRAGQQGEPGSGVGTRVCRQGVGGESAEAGRYWVGEGSGGEKKASIKLLGEQGSDHLTPSPPAPMPLLALLQ